MMRETDAVVKLDVKPNSTKMTTFSGSPAKNRDVGFQPMEVTESHAFRLTKKDPPETGRIF